jgi:hypothetical protein
MGKTPGAGRPPREATSGLRACHREAPCFSPSIIRAGRGTCDSAALAHTWAGLATFGFDALTGLHAALDRVYKLGVSLPDAPLAQFRAQTAGLPQTTEVERLVVQRIGQDIFRVALIDYWGGSCPITGITDPAFLRASHVVPWSECEDAQRLDVHNGLLLSALWDATFDTGLVSFANAGTVLVSPELSTAARTALGIERAPQLPDLRDAHRASLAAHRARHSFPVSNRSRGSARRTG